VKPEGNLRKQRVNEWKREERRGNGVAQYTSEVNHFKLSGKDFVQAGNSSGTIIDSPII
jgi:hypothetical protein